MSIYFGTSGNSPNFFKSKLGNDRLNAPEWLHTIGLNAYEVLFTYGARMSEENAKKMGQNARKFDIRLSVHAPYYCVFTSLSKKVVENSRREMKKTIRLAVLMRARRVVIHPGYVGKGSLDRFIKEMKRIELWKRKINYKIIICPELMGKKSQLGSLDELLEICNRVPCLEPCIDFGHYHARGGGCLRTASDYQAVLEKIKKELGTKILRRLHCHFYPVDFNDKGERKHMAHFEKKYFPQFAEFVKLIKKYKMKPTLISESRDSQDTAALEMKMIWEKI